MTLKYVCESVLNFRCYLKIVSEVYEKESKDLDMLGTRDIIDSSSMCLLIRKDFYWLESNLVYLSSFLKLGRQDKTRQIYRHKLYRSV
jgi:hypothetical protein